MEHIYGGDAGIVYNGQISNTFNTMGGNSIGIYSAYSPTVVFNEVIISKHSKYNFYIIMSSSF